MREQIEMLKDKSDVPTLLGEMMVVAHVRASFRLLISHTVSIHEHLSGFKGVQQIDGTQKRCLTGARRSEQDHHLAASDVHRYVPEDFIVAARHTDVASAHDDVFGGQFVLRDHD